MAREEPSVKRYIFAVSHLPLSFRLSVFQIMRVHHVCYVKNCIFLFFLFFCHGRITIASDSECIRLCLTECHLDKDRVWLRLLTVESMLEQLLTIFPDTYLHIRPPNYLFIQRSFQCWFLVSESEFWCCYTLLWRSLENSELMVEFSEVLLPVHNALLDSLAVCLK